MVKAFLSHSFVDKDIVRKIKNKLQRFWTYFDEDCFMPGEDFRNAIIERLSDTNLFVLFVSRSSLASSWVQFEIDEAYWQTVQRNNITFLVLALEEILPTELPTWMRRAKFGQVRTVQLAAQQIKQLLMSSIPMHSTVYMGREKDTANFYSSIAQYEDHIPNVFAISGLSGIGRRTFAKNILAQRFALPYVALFEIDEAEGLVELYRKLLDDNMNMWSQEEIEAYYKEFLSASFEDRVVEVARNLSLYTHAQTCPILIDNGEMLGEDGYYKDEFIELLRVFSNQYPDCYITVIHMRLPKLLYKDQKLVHVVRLHALDATSCYTLFASLLKQQSIPINDDNQVREIAGYLEGYPPAINNAVRECALEGVDLVCSDKRSLVDFQERIFKKFLDNIQLTKMDEDVLTAILNMNGICIDFITTVLQTKQDDIAVSLRRSHDYNIIELRSDGTYSIAPPMKISIERKLHRYSKNEFSEIAKRLIKEYWVPEKGIPFALIDSIIYAVLRSGQEDDLEKFKNYLLPSHLLKAAKKANQDRDWLMTETYARKALELDPDLTDAKSLLFMALVRQETSRNWERTTEEENSILDYLRGKNYKGVYYLEGFRLLKRRKYEEAIKRFTLAIQAGDNSIPTYRDLAECYYQTNQVAEAQREIDVVVKDRKINNPFILDLAAKIAIGSGEFNEAEAYLDKQELVDRPENVAHRRATYCVKKDDYQTALYYANEACNGERVLPEMHLLRMSIAIRLGDYKLAKEEYELIGKEYSHYNHEVREILHATMLLHSQGWEAAEANSRQLRGQSPYARNLRHKIVCAKLKDAKVSIFEKKRLEEERMQLESGKMFDPFIQFQCFDFQ